ncbi:MAG: hypothetical protein JJW00_03840 [Sulfurimonas sp.]|nr:hypothetical protein [Sulfurimonas sp.]
MRYVFAGLVFVSQVLIASIVKTPSDVYSQAVLLKEKIIYLRDEANIKDEFPKVQKQINKTPSHVLQKSLEVLSKVNRYRISKKYGQISMPEYPSREITPSDAYNYVKRLNEEVTPFIKDKKFLNSLKVQNFTQKTPSDVYALLWSVSLSMDPLLGMRGFAPSDVYEQSETIVAIAKFLRHSQGDFTKVKKQKSKKDLHPNHALNASSKLLEKIVKIEKRLWIKTAHIPKKRYEVITPTHVYDSLQSVIVEMQRLKTRLGIERYFEVKHIGEDKTPSDVVNNLLYAKDLLPEFRVDTKLKQYDPMLLKKTSNEVYSLTQSILNKLNIIAQHKGLSLDASLPPYIYGLSPRHVYQKAIESTEKLIRFKEMEGFYKSNIPSQPFREVTPDEVYELVNRIDVTLTLILRKNYDKSIKEYKYLLSKKITANKTPSDVYNNLWKISDNIDRLSGSTYTPNETYILAQKIDRNIDDILNYFQVKNDKISLNEASVKSPRDVFNESIKLYETLKKTRRRANIQTQNITIPQEKNITPNSVYNALRIIIASINSFKISYSIAQNKVIDQESVTGKTPTDVYKLVKLSNIKLNKLFEDDKY